MYIMHMALTRKQKAFIDEYLIDFNATQSAIRAGYSKKTAGAIGSENLKKPEIRDEIKKLLSTQVMSREEALMRLAERARFDVSDYIEDYGRVKALNVNQMIEDGYGHLIRGIKHTNKGGTIVEWSSPDDAIDRLLKEFKPSGGEGDPIHIKHIDFGLNDLSDD